jgi:hypothetical protein
MGDEERMFSDSPSEDLLAKVRQMFGPERVAQIEQWPGGWARGCDNATLFELTQNDTLPAHIFWMLDVFTGRLLSDAEAEPAVARITVIAKEAIAAEIERIFPRPEK